MPRGSKKEITYTGRALKAYEKVQKIESDLKAAKEELRVAYREQLKAEKAAATKAKKEAALAAKRAVRAKKAELLKAIEESGKTPEEIMELIKNN